MKKQKTFDIHRKTRYNIFKFIRERAYYKDYFHE